MRLPKPPLSAAFLLLLTVAFPAGPGRAEGARGGDFDYWILALSWSPSWCALEGDARGAPQCDRGRGLGWVLHGLWPQHETGWPSWCRTAARNPSRADTAAMTDIMGSAGAAWYQWKKHGRCSGLDGAAYLSLARTAYEAVARPQLLRRLRQPVRLPARVVEEAFLEANPGLEADQVTVTCKAGRIQEVRLCLERDSLSPRRCGADARRDCTLQDALLAPIR